MALQWYDYVLLADLLLVTYVGVFYLMLYLENKDSLGENRSKSKRIPKLSVIIPAYNEKDSIGTILDNIRNVEYPRDKLEYIIVDDGSSDGTLEKLKRSAKIRGRNVRILGKKHSGKASSVNFGVRLAKGELVAVVDADTLLSKNALLRCAEYFDKDDVASVTANILVRNKKKIFERWQDIEFKIVSITRKVKEDLNLIDGTPGPLSVYRKNILMKVGLFDEKILTEDIEIAWRLLDNGYKIRMAYDAVARTIYPDNLVGWIKQRVRWQIGWFQTVMKYSKTAFRKHPVGTFMFPISILSLVLQLSLIGILFYLLGYSIILNYLYISGTVSAGIFPILQLNFYPDLYTFYGILLLSLSALVALSMLKQFEKMPKAIDFATFMMVYFYLFIPVLVYSSIKLLLNKYSWGTK